MLPIIKCPYCNKRVTLRGKHWRKSKRTFCNSDCMFSYYKKYMDCYWCKKQGLKNKMIYIMHSYFCNDLCKKYRNVFVTTKRNTGKAMSMDETRIMFKINETMRINKSIIHLLGGRYYVERNTTVRTSGEQSATQRFRVTN